MQGGGQQSIVKDHTFIYFLLEPFPKIAFRLSTLAQVSALEAYIVANGFLFPHFS